MSQNATASLKILADTKAYEAGIRKMGGYTDKQVQQLGNKFRARAEREQKAAIKDMEALSKKSAEAQLATDKLGQAFSFLSPKLGEVTSKVGGLAGAGGGLGLMVAGFAAVIGAGVSLGSMVLDVTSNIDQLAESLSNADRAAIQPSINRLSEQRDRLDDASDGWTELKIVVADAVGGPLTDYLFLVGNVAQATAENSAAVDTWALDLATLPARLVTPLAPLQLLRDALGVTADAWRDVEQAQRDATFDFAADNGGTFNEPTFDMMKYAEEERANQKKRRDAYNRGVQGVQFDESRADVRTGLDAAMEPLGVRVELQDTWLGPEWQAALQHGHDLSIKLSEERIAQADKEMAAQVELRDAWIGSAESLAGTFGNITGAITDLWASSTDDAKKSAHAQAAAAKTLAVFQIGIDMARAISSALTWSVASTGPAALATGAAAVGAVGAVFADILTLVKPVPEFHTGLYRTMPDERMARVKSDEVIVDSPTVHRNGGPEGVRQQLQGGGGGPTTMQAIVQIGHEHIKAIARLVSQELNPARGRSWS